MISYLEFNRSQWASLYNSVSMTLMEDEITYLKRINKKLSFKEITEIYLPLSRLLSFYTNKNLRQQVLLKEFIGNNERRIPYIISITGSVAVGKSTIAHILQILLSRCPEHWCVELITTDGFLHPNEVLIKQDLMKKKGFPISYDMHRLVKFLSNLKSGVPHLTVPVYSHLMYDRIPNINKTVVQPDILILEGLNVLPNRIDYPNDPDHLFVSDFIDFSIYVDAEADLLQHWYIQRFLKFCEISYFNPESCFYNYAQLPKKEIINIATSIWKEINYVNLTENILPIREHANLILTKSKKHEVNQIRVRK